jgi:hypothetical protein
VKALARIRLPRQVLAAERAAAAAYRLPAWLRGDVDGIVADLMALVAPKLRRVAALPREAHWHAADAELAVYRTTVHEVGIIRRSPRKLADQARLVDALLTGAQAAVDQIRMQARADYDAACAAELAGPAVEDVAAGTPADLPVESLVPGVPEADHDSAAGVDAAFAGDGLVTS